MARPLGFVLPFSFGLLVAVASVGLLPAEIKSHAQPMSVTVVARSVHGTRAQMNHCINHIEVPRDARLAREAGFDPAVGCLAVADKILARSPSRSDARLVRAMAFHRLGKPGAAIAALEAAQAAAANEGWMAVVRTRLAFALARGTSEAALRARLLDVARADLAVLAGAAGLRQRLAFLYHEAGSFQAWMLDEMETQPPGLQRAFLRSLTQLRSVDRPQ